MSTTNPSIRSVINSNQNIRISRLGIGSQKLRGLTDVDSTVLDDGSLLIYDEGSNTFKTTTTVDKDNIIIQGGSF